ncbi:MAG: hypothetical protein H7230_00095 [Candidatus Parcubacteria bacterium]|nr:hypothetical protein [Candidatus Paceibacterota bacterium]
MFKSFFTVVLVIYGAVCTGILMLLIPYRVINWIDTSVEGSSIISQQPNAISYQSRDPYVVSLKSQFGGGCELFITQKIELSYGHSVACPAGYKRSKEKIKINWLESGLETEFEDGYKIFVPKKSFIGGR